VSWDTTTTSGASHGLTAVARDLAGRPCTSDPATVTVFNDTSPPTFTITSPSSGSTVCGAITVTASAPDKAHVAAVQFRVDDSDLGAEDTSAPYSVSWDTSTVSNGSHTLTARARDPAGKVATSSPVTVTVANDPTSTECATPLDAFPGSTLFNNTVRAQMWITDNTWWGAFSDASSGIYFHKLVGSSFVKGDLIDPNFAAGQPDTLWN